MKEKLMKILDVLAWIIPMLGKILELMRNAKPQTPPTEQETMQTENP